MRRALPALALLLVGCSKSSPSVPTARACTIAAPTPSDWRLVPDGVSFKDGLGRVVFLRGVDAGGRSKLAPFVPFDFPDDAGYTDALGAYMDRAQTWGIDVMRVPFVWEAVDPAPGADDDEGFLSRYDALLDSAWAHGIWTVVDFHQDVYSQNFCGDGFPPWTIADSGAPAPHHDCQEWALEYNDPLVESSFDTFWDASSDVQTQYQALWQRLVARYANKAGVLGFEPINEPSQGSANASAWESGTLTTFFSTMTTQMNQAAPQSLVFIDLSGPDGATLTTELGKPTGTNVVFAPHFYPILEEASESETQLTAWQTLGATWNVPTFVGEFGMSPNTDAARDYVASVFSAFDQLGLSGAEWEYSVSTLSWNNEDFSVVDADGGEHEEVQAILRPYAKAIAGSGITQSWHTTSRAFSLAYAPTAGGVSEVALPARAMPSGYDVSLTGGCYDATSAPGTMLVQPDPGATTVTLKVTAH